MKLTLGSNKCQCGACGEYFKSVSAFDMHRVEGMCVRVCLNHMQMSRRGMVKKSDGFWVTSLREYPKREPESGMNEAR